MAWQKNGTPDTLSGASDTVEITDGVSLFFNQTLFHKFGTANSAGAHQVGTGSFDVGTNYSNRKNSNGGSDSILVNQTNAGTTTFANAEDDFVISFIINIANQEKFFISYGISGGTPGAGNIVNRRETVSKWANTSTQFDRINMFNPDNGDFSVDTNLSALGTD